MLLINSFIILASPAHPLQHGHLDRHARAETARHDVVATLAHLAELVEHDEDRRAGRVAVVLVDFKRRAQLLLVQGHLLLRTVEDGDAARVQRPVEVTRIDRLTARRERAVRGERGEELLEHGGDGFEGEHGDFFGQGGPEAEGVHHELEFFGGAGHGCRFPVDQGVDALFLGALGQLVADDKGGGGVGEEDGGDFGVFGVLDDFFEVAPDVDAADFAREDQHSGRAVAHRGRLGHGGRGAHGGQSTGAADAVQECPVGVGLQTEFLGDEEVEARISGVGAGHGDDMSDVIGTAAGLTHGFLARLDGQVDTCLAEESVQFGDGRGCRAAPEWILVRFDDRSALDHSGLVDGEELLDSVL